MISCILLVLLVFFIYMTIKGWKSFSHYDEIGEYGDAFLLLMSTCIFQFAAVLDIVALIAINMTRGQQ